jgi:hypothetical protein
MSQHSKLSVSSALSYGKGDRTLPAVASEKVFNAINGTEWSYLNNREVIIRLSTSDPNAIADFKHSYLRMHVHNTNDFPIYFDYMGTSVINQYEIWAGSQMLDRFENYNSFMNTGNAMYGSNEYNEELKFLSGFPVGEAFKDGTFDLTKKSGNQRIEKKGDKGDTVEISVPIVSGLLMERLMPLFALGISFLEIRIFLEQGSVAFMCDQSITKTAGVITRTITEDKARRIDYKITKCNYVLNIISIKDNQFIANLISNLKNEGLTIATKSWRCIQTPLMPISSTTQSFVIDEKSASLCYMMNGLYLQQPSGYVSNLQPAVFGSTGYSITIGPNKYGINGQDIEYNTGSCPSFIQPYHEMQRVSSNGGAYFSTNNHHSLSYEAWTRQNPNSTLDFGTTNGKNIFGIDTTNRKAETFNTVRQSNFTQCYSFQSFDNMNGVQCGINTRALALPLTWNMNFNPETYEEDGAIALDGQPYVADRTTVIPSLFARTFICSDVEYTLLADGSWIVNK